MRSNRILIIQTAFIGDVVLAMPLIAQMRLFSPKVAIDFLVRKGNESLLADDARIQNILIWDKKEKIKNLIKLIREVRKVNYDVIINVIRFIFFINLIAIFYCYTWSVWCTIHGR